RDLILDRHLADGAPDGDRGRTQPDAAGAQVARDESLQSGARIPADGPRYSTARRLPRRARRADRFGAPGAGDPRPGSGAGAARRSGAAREPARDAPQDARGAVGGDRERAARRRERARPDRDRRRAARGPRGRGGARDGPKPAQQTEPAESEQAMSRKQSKPAAEYELRLYVAGQNARSIAALANLKKVCDTHLNGRYSVEVIDLLEKPQLAKGDQILAVPTLVRKLPAPLKKIIGDLSNTERVLIGLDLKALT